MLTPRNTLVVCRMLLKDERKVGKIVVPANNDMYGEAEVLAVGPGNLSAEGGRSETHDLHPGQIVLVKYQDVRPMGNALAKSLAGIEYQDGDKKLVIFEQMSVIAIIEQPPLQPSKQTADERACFLANR
jgi:co-chaperonin GroES (HSP10)